MTPKQGIPFVLLVLAIGCNSNDLAKVTVTGEVRYNGKPLQNGQIRFVPIEGTAGPVSGGVIVDGKYAAEGKGGVPLGKHRVEIRAYRPMRTAGGDSLGEGSASEQFLPGRYNGRSILNAIVTRETASGVNFDLEGP